MQEIFDGDDPGDEPPRLDWDDNLSDHLHKSAAARVKRNRGPRHYGPIKWAAAAVAVVAFSVIMFGAVSAGLSQQTTPSVRISESRSTHESHRPAAESPSAAIESRSVVQVPAPIRRLDATWDPLDALSSLPVIEQARSLSETPYDRAFFGQEWMDVDRNGCDTRNDMLRRDLDDLVVREGTHGCVAYSGRFVDPYTAETFYFERGSGNAGELHVDHIVALSDAWRKGAADWNEETRVEFANDPMNLVVTFGDINMSKGANDAGAWLPPHQPAHCAFAVHVVWVKDRYNLAVSQNEAITLGDVLDECGEPFSELVGDGE